MVIKHVKTNLIQNMKSKVQQCVVFNADIFTEITTVKSLGPILTDIDGSTVLINTLPLSAAIYMPE
jgi:hypothetical protein